MTVEPAGAPLEIIVVGGGIAALEAVLALDDLAGDRVRVTLVAPEPDVVLRPMAVATPFSRGHVERLPLSVVMDEHGGRFVRSAVKRVDAASRTLTLVSGHEVGYDVLVLAHGAAEVPVLEHAMTFGEHADDFNGLLADIDEGYSRVIAFVVPDGNTWPLPLYELALMTAGEAWAMNMDRVQLHLFTPELAPLDIFGPEASAALAELLVAAGITVHTDAHAQTAAHGRIDTGDGQPVTVGRVVALPILEGRRLDGVPSDARGFIAVDPAGLVLGLDDVYAVGDATDRPIKQGGLACQQADAVAAHIAARAGADVEVPELQQVLRGRLLTGGRDRFMERATSAAAGTSSAEPLWWPPSKVSGRYLTPYLTAKDLVHLPPHGVPAAAGVDVSVPVEPLRRVPGGIVADADADAGAPLRVGLRG